MVSPVDVQVTNALGLLVQWRTRVEKEGTVGRAPLTPLDAALWEWVGTSVPPSLGSSIDRASAQNPSASVQVTFETVFTETGRPFDFIKPRGVISAERATARGVDLLRLEDEDGGWVVAAFETGREGVFHLVGGLPTTHPRWQRVDRWINAARGVLRCYLDHEDFESVGDRLSEFGDVEVGRMTARVVTDSSSMTRGFPSRAGLLRPTHIDVISEAETRGASVRTLTLHVHDVLSLHLRRTAGATYYSGRFDLFEDLVLSRLADAAAARRSLMVNRQRRPMQAVRPVVIRLDRPLLVTADDTGKVIDQIQGMAQLSVAVFHRNPYLHIAVTDEVDGSNFDLMVTDPAAIAIYPGFRASMDSLTRVTQQLGEHFGARDIVDPGAPKLVSLTELTF